MGQVTTGKDWSTLLRYTIEQSLHDMAVRTILVPDRWEASIIHSYEGTSPWNAEVSRAPMYSLYLFLLMSHLNMKMCTEVLNTSYSKTTCTIDYQNNYEQWVSCLVDSQS